MVGLLRRSVAFKNVKSGLYINVQDDGGDHSPLWTCASKIPFASQWTPHMRPDGKWSFDSHTGHWMNVKNDGAEHSILWTLWTRSSNLKRINMWRSSGYKNDDVETVLADEASTRPRLVAALVSNHINIRRDWEQDSTVESTNRTCDDGGSKGYRRRWRTAILGSTSFHLQR